jgi:hypothetical protein
MPIDMSIGLQFVHLSEVSGEAFVFGWIVVALLHHRHEPQGNRQPSRSEVINVSPSHNG